MWWIRLVLSPETTVDFVVVFLFVGYVLTASSLWQYPTRPLPCVASGTACVLRRTYVFPVDALPLSSSHIWEGSQGGRRLICISRLSNLAGPCKQEGVLCRWRCHCVVCRLFSGFIGLRDPDGGLQLVVEVLVDVFYLPQLAIDCQHRNACFVCNFLLIVVLFLVGMVPWVSIFGLSLVKYRHYSDFILQSFNHLRLAPCVLACPWLGVSQPHGARHTSWTLRDEVTAEQSYQ